MRFPNPQTQKYISLRDILPEYPPGELGKLHLIRALGTGVEHMRLVLAKFPQSLSLANTPSAIQNDQLSALFFVLALQKRQLRFSANKHDHTAFIPNRDLLNLDLI